MNKNIAASVRARLFNPLPVGLTDEFSGDATRQALWHAFLRKNELPGQALPDIVTMLRKVLEPTLCRATALDGHQIGKTQRKTGEES